MITKPASWLYQNDIQKIDESDFLQLCRVPYCFLREMLPSEVIVPFCLKYSGLQKVIMVFRYKTRAGHLSISKKTQKLPNISQPLYHGERGNPRFRHRAPGWD